MVIFLPHKIKPTGGSSSFALKLQAGLRAKKHQVVFQFQPHFDLLLVNALCPLRYLLFAKLTRRPIVHRLDGVYYPQAISRSLSFFYNLPLQIILHFFAHAVIYQSQYAKSCCDRFLGPNPYIPAYLIYNGVDTKLFCPRGPAVKLRAGPHQPVFISVSRWRRPDQILPIITAFRLYQQFYQPTAKLILIGNFTNPVANLPALYRSDASISFLGPIPNPQLPAYYRAANVFLFSHLNPPCPNNVLEAMACGLPICGVADGAMLEITSPGLNCALIPAAGNGFYQPRQLDLRQFAANLNKIMSNRDHYSSHSRLIASNRFTLRDMIKQYLQIFTCQTAN